MNVIVLPFSQHACNFEGHSTLEVAQGNMAHLIADAGLDDSVTVSFQGYNDGYCKFRLHRWLRTCDVSMPGFSIERVRYLGLANQNIWQFPRLYIDGSSWVWKFAIGIARERLIGEGICQ